MRKEITSIKTSLENSYEKKVFDKDKNEITWSPSNFNLTGRFYIESEKDEIQYASVWTGAQIEFSFFGTEAWCYLSGQETTSDMEGVFVGVYIDDNIKPSKIISVTKPDWYCVGKDLPKGKH